MISSIHEATGETRVAKLLKAALEDSSLFLDESELTQIGIQASYGILTQSGVWIINVYLDAGKVEAKAGGTWRRPEDLLFVNGRHRLDLIESVLGQTDLTRAWLRDRNDHLVPVSGALCFCNSGLSLLNGFNSLGTVSGVWVGGISRLIRKIKSDPALTPSQLDSVRSSIESHHRRLED